MSLYTLRLALGRWWLTPKPDRRWNLASLLFGSIRLCLLLFFGYFLLAILLMIYGVTLYPIVFAWNIKQGKPIVQAVYRYRSATGLYPGKLDDLVPAYLAGVPQDWRYLPARNGRPPRLQLHGGYHSYLSYYFARPSDSKQPGWMEPEGWEYNQEGTGHFQGRDKVPVPPFEKSDGELVAARLKELRRRLETAGNDDERQEAYTRLISELVRLARLDEARASCRDCIDRLDSQWCLMALAELDLRRGSRAGLDELVAWTKRSPTFPRYAAIALVHRMHGQSAEALAALREAVRYPLNADDEGFYMPEYYGLDSALFAYQSGQPELALSICDNWERCVRAKGWGEESYHAIRAAAYLALGRQSDAAREAAKAVAANRQSKTWADNLPALERAIQAGDRSFVYGPECPQPLHPLFLEEVQ